MFFIHLEFPELKGSVPFFNTSQHSSESNLKDVISLHYFWQYKVERILLSRFRNIRIKSLLQTQIPISLQPVSEFNEFKPRLQSPKNRFKLSAGLKLEKLNTILSGTNHI